MIKLISSHHSAYSSSFPTHRRQYLLSMRFSDLLFPPLNRLSKRTISSLQLLITNVVLVSLSLETFPSRVLTFTRQQQFPSQSLHFDPLIDIYTLSTVISRSPFFRARPPRDGPFKSRIAQCQLPRLLFSKWTSGPLSSFPILSHFLFTLYHLFNLSSLLLHPLWYASLLPLHLTLHPLEILPID